MTVQVLSCVVVGGLLAGGGLFGYKTFFKKHPSGAFAKSQADLFQQLGQSSAGATKVLLVGDGTALATMSGVAGNFEDGGIDGVGFSPYGCGINQGGSLLNGKAVALPAVCKAWPKQYASIAKAFNPDAVVLMTGTTEGRDAVVNGQVLKAGTAPAAVHLETEIDAARRATTRPGTRFFLLAPMCTRSATGHLDIRRAWVKQVYEQYAASHKGVVVADADPLLCPHGTVAHDKQGHAYLKLGFPTDAGSAAIWTWLAKTVQAPTPA